MKIFLALVLATLTLGVGPSFAMPVPANVEFRLNHGVAPANPGVLLGYQVISNKVQLLKCTYSFAVQGGSSAAAINLKGPDGADCKLPLNAIVMEGLIDVLTAPTSSGSATVAVGTGQAANDLKTATAKASFTGKLDVVPVWTAATAIKMTATRTPTVTIAVSDLTAGKFNVFIHYLLSN